MGNTDHKGGLIIHFMHLIKFLKSKENINLFVVNINDNNEKNFKSSDYKEISLPYKPKNKIHKFLLLLITALKARFWNPDIFIACGPGHGFNFLARILGSSTFKIQQEVHYDAKMDSLRMVSVKVFDAIAVQTKSMVNNYKLNVSDKISVNYLPCFSKKLEIPRIKRIKKNNQYTKIAFFGRLAINKGLEPFISNVKDVILKEKILLNIHGMGPSLDAIAKTIENNGLSKQVKILGPYSDKEYVNLLNSYDAVIIPSIFNEGLPLVTIEAMSFGLPIFASKMGAFPEISRLNKSLVLTETDKKSQNKNFLLFVKNLKKGIYCRKEISKIYQENFSNKIFEKEWLKMLEFPKKYFK